MPESAERIELLAHTVQELAQARDLERIVDIVRHAARKLMEADGATLILREQGLAYYAGEDSIAPLWQGQKFPLHLCIGGWAMLHRECVVAEDVFADPRIRAEVYRKTFVKSLAVMPVGKENPIAAIGCYWAETHKVTEGELKLLQALAHTTAVAIENVNLVSSLEQRITELKKADEAKDAFLQVLSHELRTPLNGILGWSSILASSPRKQNLLDRGLDTIERSAQALAHIIDDLLDTTRIIAGKLRLDIRRVDLGDIVRTVQERTAPEAQKKRITVSFDNRTESASVLGDAARLQQVVGNLLDNAIKFTPPGGRVDLSLVREGPMAHLTVRDSGEGISADFLPHVFERFRQSDSSTTRQHGGMGLGLTIVKHLVGAHGGYVEAASEGPGQGASFGLFLPLDSLDSELPHDPLLATEAAGRLQGIRVIAVDDNPDALHLSGAILEQSGAEVRLADGAYETLRLLQEFQPDVLLCDLSMPEVDGFELLRRIKNEHHLRIPAVALTAFADDTHRKRAQEIGFDAFLGKPVQPTKLVDAIASLAAARSPSLQVQNSPL